MSATFACPHCGATYPVKPVLVGKPVRCTKCKNAFRLRPDGIADKVEMEAPAPAPAAPPPAPAPAPPPPAAPRPAPTPKAPEKPAATAVAAPPAPAPAAAADAAAARAEAARKLNQKQEEARRAMAGTLANAAAEALKAEAVKREAVKDEKAKKAPAAGKSSAGSQRIGPVLVVGEGEREARNTRAWVVGSIVVIAVIAGLVALASLRTAQRKAVEGYAAPVEEQYARYPNRLPRMQSRAWLAGGPALIDLGKLRMGDKKRYELAGARPVLAAIAKDQTYLQQYDLWAPTADSAKLAKAWSPKRDREANLQALKDAGLAVTTRAELEAKLREAGLAAEGAAVVMELLLPTVGSPQGAAQRIAKGELPDAIEVATFRGTHGTVLQDAGNTYKFPFMDYTGTVLRFVGEGWPQEWRVLAIESRR